MKIFLLSLCFLIASCASNTGVVDADEPVEQELEQSAKYKGVNQSIVFSGSHAAVTSLMSKADEFIQMKNYEQAAAYIERALRLDPKNGRIYLGLAKVNFFQDRYNEANAFVERARSLAGSDTSLIKSIEQFEQVLASKIY